MSLCRLPPLQVVHTLLHRADKTKHEQRNRRTAHRENRPRAMSPEGFQDVGNEFEHDHCQHAYRVAYGTSEITDARNLATARLDEFPVVKAELFVGDLGGVSVVRDHQQRDVELFD